MIAETEKELLNDAFNIFRNASEKLESQYSLLEERIEELNAELAEKNRAMERTRRLAAMGEMAAKIAHELRNPLGSIAIFATLLERELKDEPSRCELAGRISKGVKTLDNLLSNMLLFASSPVARKKPVDLKDVIEDSAQLTRAYFNDMVKLKTAYQGPTGLQGDDAQLRQLFVNLLLNAAEAVKRSEPGPGGGLVEVVAGPAGDQGTEGVRIEVRDNGCGIDADSVDRVFDPFFSTTERGTGLGLAIVASVVNAHSGDISVSSTPGKGTAFTILLPAGRD